jgi:hypothetical protein
MFSVPPGSPFQSAISVRFFGAGQRASLRKPETVPLPDVITALRMQSLRTFRRVRQYWRVRVLGDDHGFSLFRRRDRCLLGRFWPDCILDCNGLPDVIFDSGWLSTVCSTRAGYSVAPSGGVRSSCRCRSGKTRDRHDGLWAEFAAMVRAEVPVRVARKGKAPQYFREKNLAAEFRRRACTILHSTHEIEMALYCVAGVPK